MTTSTSTRLAALRRRPDQQGSALIMALLIILALTGLGLVGLKHTTFELRQANNARFSKQAIYTAEVGMMGAMQRVGKNGQAFWDYMDRFQRQRQRQFNDNSSPEYPFFSADFLTQGKVFGTPLGSFETEQNTPANFSVVFTEPRDGPRPPGFSKEFCFKRFTFEATGNIGTPEANLRYDDAVRSATSRTISHALVGPLICDEGFGL